jgi:CRP-like cAMP-binding protein
MNRSTAHRDGEKASDQPDADTRSKVTAFFTAFPVKTIAKGEVIVQAGEEPEAVFYLTDGRVNQYDITPAGTTVVVNVFKPFAFFPMSWAINRTPNEYFYEAGTEVTFHKVPADAAVAFLRENPDVLFDLLSRVYRGADGLLRRMAHLMGGQAKARLQFELLNAAYRFGDIRPDGAVAVPLKESDLGSTSGLARETVNRNLQELKAAGLIEITRQGFVITDLARLERMASGSL